MTLSNFFELDPTFLNPTVVPGENVRALFIPLNAYKFNPTAQEAMLETDGKAQRMIYHRNINLTQKELT
jgi:hypothetical protein